MSTGLRMTEQEFADYCEKRDRNKQSANPSRTSAGRDVEQRAIDEPQAANAVQAFVQKVDIRFTHYRRRLADPDNFATKHFVDGLVEAGILRDDNSDQVSEVRHRQVKIEQWQDEYIEIHICPAKAQNDEISKTP